MRIPEHILVAAGEFSSKALELERSLLQLRILSPDGRTPIPDLEVELRPAHDRRRKKTTQSDGRVQFELAEHEQAELWLHPKGQGSGKPTISVSIPAPGAGIIDVLLPPSAGY